MCGIVGGVDNKDVKNNIINSINYLEYRGYDSAGISLCSEDNELETFKLVGKVREIKNIVSKDSYHNIGIAHTRWATHGKVCLENAHPHTSKNRVSIVHNGIIENYIEIKEELENYGYKFKSETDSETIAVLINYYLDQKFNLFTAFEKTINKLKGSFAIAAIDSNDKKNILIATKDSPLVIGLTNTGNYIASDQIALLDITNKFIYLKTGTIGCINKDEIKLQDFFGKTVRPEIITTQISTPSVRLGTYKHYMHKEIHQQVEITRKIISDKIDHKNEKIQKIIPEIKRIKIIACGSSYNAGHTAKYWFEEHCQIATDVEIASEYRHHNYINNDGDLLIFISQSGETADTLSALRESKSKPHLATIAICNEEHSAIVRESDIFLNVLAGKEIGVASTKAFTAQLMTLLFLCFEIKGYIPEDIRQGIYNIPSEIAGIIKNEEQIANLAKTLFNVDNIIFLGRNINFPIAAEGALKLKEISYINSNAYPAGELKHGPLALIDSRVHLIYLAPSDKILEKNLNNMAEIEARDGKITHISDQYYTPKDKTRRTALKTPCSNTCLFPIVANVAQQLLSYHVAVYKGHDVDQPRNLAKSVTVE
jgi:glucosamine--fructose-6-phosphate aminotransferase (isomerizing)